MRIESHTETMIDFAYVERARGHYRVAIAALDSLLALPDAAHPSDIRAAMAALQRHVGSLMIYTTPENARVEVDDVRVVGHAAIPLDEGAHTVKVDAPGYARETVNVMVPGGVHRLVEIRLHR